MLKLIFIFLLIVPRFDFFETAGTEMPQWKDWADYPIEYITTNWSGSDQSYRPLLTGQHITIMEGQVFTVVPNSPCTCLSCLCNIKGECVAGCCNAGKVARIINGYDYIAYVNLDECLNEWEHREVYIPKFLASINFIILCTSKL